MEAWESQQFNFQAIDQRIPVSPRLGLLIGQVNAATDKSDLRKASHNAAYGVQHGGNGDGGDTE